MWSPTKSAVKDLVEIMYKYSDYLKKCLEKVKTNQSYISCAHIGRYAVIEVDST